LRGTVLRWGAVAALVAVVTGELFARFYLGLGTPPLWMAHPRIEYLFKPDQHVHRFGQYFVINSYGMRSEPFEPRRQAGELRVMVFGDSVVNGGSITDQKDLATVMIRSALERSRGRTVTVGNVSAGSWGPGNWLAYAKEYGFFDADIVVLVISSHDYADNPTFTPLNPKTHPTEAPLSALMEGIRNYLPRYLPARRGAPLTEADRFAAADESQAIRALNDLRQFLQLAAQNGRQVLIFQHLERAEIDAHRTLLGYERIRSLCQSLGIEPISLEADIRRSLAQGIDPYRDNIHPNAAGQRVLAEAILKHLPR
jgi:hypothetical protein